MEPTLIAEIGGSSSRWAYLPTDGPEVLLPVKGERMPGFNPVAGDAEGFIAGVRAQVVQHCPAAFGARRLFVYGAGCGAADRQLRMQQVLAPLFPSAVVDVQSDLDGAALGLCGSGPGLVLILGTGMNAGYFDGRTLHRPMPSLGYILGDEGSGADLGRTLLQDVFYRRMPEDAALALLGPDGLALERVIAEVYRSTAPSRALAAYTGLLLPHRELPYVHGLVVSRFHALADLLKTFFTLDQRAEVCATGSVAWGFKDWLTEVLLDHGMTLRTVERDPLPGLVSFHRQVPPPGL
jgi:N-acetylglucosamine kinase-like BadF-type ATPase